ncbi:DNA topoisomerase IB [Sphingobacterium faecium]|uniref:DNA topoisomerase IB n=1 Tax=Sphingobacterium faecium TaxID=34087 RepID=UPI002468DF2D|nr:DNA topoisomerase IB [Sphingobacterium faecium]MDH5826803.1 DNA topoisomerase IB [Sphingobacterium faecium]
MPLITAFHYNCGAVFYYFKLFMKSTIITPHPATELHLRFVTDKDCGYSRIDRKGNFVYFYKQKPLIDHDIIDRIESLSIPPAWQDVWICKFKNGHIQVTGTDSLGRKQYIYHPEWSSLRNLKKFDRLCGFGKKLKLLREQITKDLRRKTLNKNKVCAIALYTMDATHIRAGNKSYEKKYGSYGLTTLKNRHVIVDQNEVFFKFKGKKGVLQQVYLKEAKIARMLKNVKEIPGQELFQYYDKSGTIQKLESGDINNYLKYTMLENYTCKDFRTWAGCTMALKMMVSENYSEMASNRKKIMISILESVAKQLGNTRSVTRKYYVHPELQKQYLDGTLAPIIARLKKKTYTIQIIEKAFLKFIHSLK